MDYKEVVKHEINECSTELCDLAMFLHSNPETAYQEVKAHDYITNYLERKNFKVERNFIHPTGFRATFETSSSPHFAILVEYDALPLIGHACGHNIIAESSIAAAIGLKAAMEKGLTCKLSVLGTPAEEKGGGKIKFVTEGIFNDIDLSIMSHPFNKNALYFYSLAVIGLRVTFTGKETHASVLPWEGINALDAAVLAYQSISCLRQQMQPDFRIHGIISKGGTVPNIIPNLTEMEYNVRAPTVQLLKEFIPRVYDCFHGAAKMTHCEVNIVETCNLYEDILSNPTLLKVFEKNAISYGMSFEMPMETFRGSSDVGNVSHVCPTIHPVFTLGEGFMIHTKEFSIGSGTTKAVNAGILQGKIMSGTLIDILLDKDGNLLKNIKLDFQNQILN